MWTLRLSKELRELGLNYDITPVDSLFTLYSSDGAIAVTVERMNGYWLARYSVVSPKVKTEKYQYVKEGWLLRRVRQLVMRFNMEI